MNKGHFFATGLLFGIAITFLCLRNNELLETQNTTIKNNRIDFASNVFAITNPENGYVPDEKTAIAIA